MEKLQNRILNAWYAKSVRPWLKTLLPLAKVYAKITDKKRQKILALESKIYATKQFSEKNDFLCRANRHIEQKIPLIIVGNLTLGGTGKTPVVVALCKFLQTQNYRVAIISRGYGGKAKTSPQIVNAKSKIAEVGDEAMLLYALTQAWVIVDKVRAKALDTALELGANVIISDDGLQHFGIVGQIKYAVVDSSRGFGNREVLPMGPLREKPLGVLASLDGILQNLSGGEFSTNDNLNYIQQLQKQLDLMASQTKNPPKRQAQIYNFSLKSSSWQNGAGQVLQGLPFEREQKVHALAGIGNPQRFFKDLENMGLKIIPHIFADHAELKAEYLQADDNLPWVMTAKDGVKLKNHLSAKHWIYNIEASFSADFYTDLLTKISNIKKCNGDKNG